MRSGPQHGQLLQPPVLQQQQQLLQGGLLRVQLVTQACHATTTANQKAEPEEHTGGVAPSLDQIPDRVYQDPTRRYCARNVLGQSSDGDGEEYPRGIRRPNLQRKMATGRRLRSTTTLKLS